MKKTLVIFSGAGLSSESGIPTFRDMGGFWENYRIEEIASPAAWFKNKQAVLDFYAMRITKYRTCKPNAAHYAIAKLQAHFDVVAITQNVDNLHEQAGVKNVWHLHGNIMCAKCEAHCDSSQDDHHTKNCDYKTNITKPLTLEDICPKCGENLRPDIVWFGEAVDMRENFLAGLIPKTDIFIGVGTSAQVYPAAGLLHTFQQTGEKYFIDPNPLYTALKGYDVIVGQAAVELPNLADRLIQDLI